MVVCLASQASKSLCRAPYGSLLLAGVPIIVSACAETCKLARDTRLTRASELILSAPGGPDCEQPSACTTAGTTRVNSDAASTVATATAVEDKVVRPPHRACSPPQPCGSHAKDALTPSLAVTSAGANSHVSCDALRGERSRTTPLAIASEGANSSASDVFQPGLSQDEVRQRIRQGMGSGVGPRYDIVELAQCMTAFEQSLQAVRPPTCLFGMPRAVHMRGRVVCFACPQTHAGAPLA